MKQKCNMITTDKAAENLDNLNKSIDQNFSIKGEDYFFFSNRFS